MEVGSAYVRIRPRVSDEDIRALQALDLLTHEIAAAFDRFNATIASDPATMIPSSVEKEKTDVAA